MKDQIISKNWDDLSAWADQQNITIPPSYLSEATDRKYHRDAFSLGQLASKIWLINKLYPIASHPIKDWVLLGCWIGTLVPFLHNRFIINRIYGIDLDTASVELSEVFNRAYFQDNWKYKGVVADVQYLETNCMQIQTAGELIEFKPGVVINTSCEHMGNEWFETADKDQLIVMQTNNSENFDGHINTCSSIDEMQEKYPLQDARYIGSFEMPTYTRYMQIGYK